MEPIGSVAIGQPNLVHAGPTEEVIIPTGLKPASWAYAESFVAEDEVLSAARSRAADLNAVPVGSGAGATLRFLAAMLEARNVVEIGTGCGVSGVWLMRGMRSDGVLTSVDIEVEHQRLAKEAFTAAGFPPQRVRLIPGAALDVLPRLTDGHYDLVFCDGDKREYPHYLEQALRLLRPGGVVAFDNALWHDRVADNSVRDLETTTIRETLAAVRDDDRLAPAAASRGRWPPGGAEGFGLATLPGGAQVVTELSASSRALASSALSSTTSRPPPSMGDPHHEPAAFLRDLQGTVTRPRLHRRHSHTYPSS